MKKVIELAPAKINLYLKVLRKRPDRYHDIETLFERIGIFDKITILSAKEGISIECTDPSIPIGRQSLCYRAIELLKKTYKIKKGIKVRIEKNIPVAAGLGGGSSDAASILKALNSVWKLGFKKRELMNMAGTLGADIPFFLSDSPFAIGTERGDFIKPIKSNKSFWHVIICPNIRLLSSQIYKLYSELHSLNLTIKRPIDRILSPTLNINSVNGLKKLLHNDLEQIVLSREPLIKNIKDILARGYKKNTLVSGSGPSVFGIYGTKKEAVKAKEDSLKRFPNSQGWRTFVTKTF